MKVKQKVAALCLAAVVATSVGASAGGVYGHWQTRTPNNSAEGGAAAWSHGLKDKGTTVTPIIDRLGAKCLPPWCFTT